MHRGDKQLMLMVLQDVTKTFVSRGSPRVNVLNGVSLQVEEGEMLAICGASGSGKSTLLNIIGCLDNPTSGFYWLDGVDMTHANNTDLARARNKTFGFVMQQFSLVEEDRVLENVCIPLLFAKRSRSLSSIEHQAMEQLEQFGIDALAKKPVLTLSGGEKQRVAIARALVNQPKIILADEPTGALDKQNSTIVMETLQSLHKIGKTIIIVTHDNHIARYCNRCVTISDGRLIG